MGKHEGHSHISRDIAIIGISIFVAINLSESGAIEKLVEYSLPLGVVASFIAGLFFTSVFTTVPAIVALYEISLQSPVILVAFFGALGAFVGDFIMFRFLKDTLIEDLTSFLNNSAKRRFTHFIKTSYVRWLLVLIGGAIIASPLPDELGLMMMGISKTNTKLFVLISLISNFIGILIIGLIARSLQF